MTPRPPSLAQKLSQVQGIGEVTVGGGSLPAVRAELTPQALYRYGVGLEDVRAALASANAHSPKGGIDAGTGVTRFTPTIRQQGRSIQVTGDRLSQWRAGGACPMVGEVTDSVEKPPQCRARQRQAAILVVLYRQPGGNIIDIVDRVKALMPQLRASVSPAIDLGVAVDRSTTIRSSLRDVEVTLIVAIFLVIVVVFAFLRNWRATLCRSWRCRCR